MNSCNMLQRVPAVTLKKNRIITVTLRDLSTLGHNTLSLVTTSILPNETVKIAHFIR